MKNVFMCQCGVDWWTKRRLMRERERERKSGITDYVAGSGTTTLYCPTVFLLLCLASNISQ